MGGSRLADRRQWRERWRGSVPRGAPGRDRHGAAGPLVLRVVRRHDRRARRSRRPASGLDRSAAARLTIGRDASPPVATPGAPATDTGEALGLDPARLTLTFGFGSTALRPTTAATASDWPPADRTALADLPHFPGDELDPDRSGGDLCVQACGNDPQVAYPRDPQPRHGSVAGGSRCAGCNRGSAGRRHRGRPGDAPQPHGVQGRHEQPARRRIRTSTAASGSPAPPNRRGCATAATSWHAASACTSRSGTATASPTRSRRSAGAGKRRAAQRPPRTRRSTCTPGQPMARSLVPARRPCPAGQPEGHRHLAPPPWLLVHRRHRPAYRPARRRPVLPRVPSGPATSSSCRSKPHWRGVTR